METKLQRWYVVIDQENTGSLYTLFLIKKFSGSNGKIQVNYYEKPRWSSYLPFAQDFRSQRLAEMRARTLKSKTRVIGTEEALVLSERNEELLEITEIE